MKILLAFSALVLAACQPRTERCHPGNIAMPDNFHYSYSDGHFGALGTNGHTFGFNWKLPQPTDCGF